MTCTGSLLRLLGHIARARVIYESIPSFYFIYFDGAKQKDHDAPQNQRKQTAKLATVMKTAARVPGGNHNSVDYILDPSIYLLIVDIYIGVASINDTTVRDACCT